MAAIPKTLPNSAGYQAFERQSETIELPPIGIRLSLNEIYERV